MESLQAQSAKGHGTPSLSPTFWACPSTHHLVSFLSPRVFPTAGENTQPADHQELHLRIPPPWHHGPGYLLQLLHRGHGSEQEVPWHKDLPGHIGRQLPGASAEGVPDEWR